MLNEMFYAVLGMLPWTCALIAALLALRHFARKRLSARFFRLAWLVLAVRLALPVSFAVPVQGRPAPLSIPVPTATVQRDTRPQSQQANAAQTAGAPWSDGQLPGISAQNAVVSAAGTGVPGASLSEYVSQPEARQGLSGVSWTELIAAVWLCGAALCLAMRLGAYGVSMRRLQRRRMPLKNSETERLCRATFGHDVPAYTVQGLATPMLAGLLRPAVYLPEDLPGSAELLPYVLAHEARHRCAGDIPYQFVLLLACAVQWFNPLAWYMARAARQDLELACDEAVLAGRDMAYRRAYGAAVLDVLASARRRRLSMLSTGFAARHTETKQRFAEMLSIRQKRRGAPLLCLLLAAVTLASALVACAAAPAQTGSLMTDVGAQERLRTELLLLQLRANTQRDTAADASAQETPEEQLERLRGELEALRQEIAGLESTAEKETALPDPADKTLEELQQQYQQAQTQWEEWSAARDGGALPGDTVSFDWPLPGYTVLSADFGTVFITYGVQNAHRGMDIPAPAGTPVYAAAGGIVSTQNHWAMGISVKLDHGGSLATLYGHLSARAVEDGDAVIKGQLIGYVGSTGNSTGNHLHFEVNLDGAPVSAWPYLADA